MNEFWVLDVDNYGATAPCRPKGGQGTHDNNRVDERTDAPAQVVMVFKPLRKYGACYPRLDGGYVNTAMFSTQLDLGRSISLTVHRDDSGEEYHLYYFLVEIFQ